MCFHCNLDMHKQIDMLCQHRWRTHEIVLRPSFYSFLSHPLIVVNLDLHDARSSTLSFSHSFSSYDESMCWQLGTNQHSYQVHYPCASVYKYSIPVFYIYIFDVCIFHRHPILTFLLGFVRLLSTTSGCRSGVLSPQTPPLSLRCHT